jgi:hypothetical protein
MPIQRTSLSSITPCPKWELTRNTHALRIYDSPKQVATPEQSPPELHQLARRRA